MIPAVREDREDGFKTLPGPEEWYVVPLPEGFTDCVPVLEIKIYFGPVAEGELGLIFPVPDEDIDVFPVPKGGLGLLLPVPDEMKGTVRVERCEFDLILPVPDGGNDIDPVPDGVIDLM